MHAQDCPTGADTLRITCCRRPACVCVRLRCSWAVVWIPLWVYDAVGMYYFVYLVSLGKVSISDVE
jgi:hypothetical protein